MAIQTINIGTTANDGTGDDPRTAGSKINDNFINSTHAASRDVGTASGNVMEVGAFGLGSKNLPNTGAPVLSTQPTGFFNKGSESGIYASRVGIAGAYGFQLFANPTVTGGGMTLIRHFEGVERASEKLWTTGNTTVDGSGFIKEASPIVKLYSDKIELNDYKELGSCEFERVDTGHYIIKGAPLLSRNGWYIETLKDRNNNIYFTLDYEELEDGLHIKTYEPDYSTGRATNGAPVDINDGRFVTLRFEEDKTEE